MSFRLRPFFAPALVCAALGSLFLPPQPALADPPAAPLTVKAKHKPSDKEWKEYPSRTVETLPGFKMQAAPPPLDKWGGRSDKKGKPTGFFHTQKTGERWVMVDPDGNEFLLIGVNSVAPGKGQSSQTALQAKYPGGEKAWAQAETERLRGLGFNDWGAWSAQPLLREASSPAPWVYGPTEWNDTTGKASGFMQTFGKQLKIVKQGTGHSNFVGDCLPVFHPDWEPFCNEYAKRLSKYKNDPYLIGYLTDNELPTPQLDKYLALDANDKVMGSSRKEAQEWLNARKGGKPSTIADATQEDRDEWAAVVYARYFATTTRAIRANDPNHLCLGPRLYAAEKRNPAVFRAAGKYLDVIAINHYNSWSPTSEEITRWTHWSGKPTLITEWYAKGGDSGFANTGGAGWLVETQRDRGIFYQTFTLALLQTQTCVGWHWFKYMDNDPTVLSADPSNTDSNKGIVTAKYEVYAPLADAMRDLNRRVYNLADYFDALAKPAPANKTAFAVR